MELRQLKYFVEVGRLGSFSLASKSLFITQSTISQQIQKLEEELGVELLTRDTRHVTLSDYGEQFFPCAVQVLEEARAGAERIQDVKALQVGTLSVGATYSFGPLLKQTVLDFYRKYPPQSGHHLPGRTATDAAGQAAGCGAYLQVAAGGRPH